MSLVAALDARFPFTRALCFFGIALLLALLEIQIEGPHGWAERLPTWRLDGPRIRRFLGKPVTGYHVYLNLILAAFFHLPLLYAEPSVRLESEILCFYFLLTIVWDFLWFALNPAYGLRRFRKGEIWWLPTWAGRVPTAYLSGAAASLAAWIAPSLLRPEPPLGPRAVAWGFLLAELLLLSAAAAAAAHLRARRPPPP